MAQFVTDIASVGDFAHRLHKRRVAVVLAALADACRRYLAALKQTSRQMTKSGLKIETFDYARCKGIIDEIDRILAKLFALDEEESDFILNYDIKYRMGADDDSGEED